jgi:hypothetical protein
MAYYAQLSTGMIVKSETNFTFSNGFSDNTNLSIRLPNEDKSPYRGFYLVKNFTFKKDEAVCYWESEN